MSKKPLGRSTGSLNAPIAAFTMAVVLCSYCIYSINSARRGVHVQQGQGQGQGQFESSSSASSSAQSQAMRRQRQDDWVRKALEEKEKERSGRGG